MTQNPHKTALHSVHEKANARMAPFAGFDMPIQYSGIIEEHRCTRQQAGIFDTCHMGEFIVDGDDAAKDLDYLLTANIADMRIGKCRYSLMCNHQGGVLDDLIVYRLAGNRFMIVVNAGTQEDDLEWIRQNVSESTIVENISESTAKIDVQGPHSPAIMSSLLDNPIEDLKYFSFEENFYNGQKIIISRTGYTGEIGFEVYLQPDTAVSFWEDTVNSGAAAAGLGARDTLRLEVGLPLYGHELCPERNAMESGFTFAIADDKNFIGADQVHDPEQQVYRLTGLLIDGQRSVRENDIVYNPADSSEIGWITSGSFSPSLEKPIALAYIKKNIEPQPEKVTIARSKKSLEASLTKPPFYTKGTAREKISKFL